MSHFVAEIPEVVVKTGKMINYSSSKMKALGAAVVLMLYIYFLLFLKTFYMRAKKLEQIMEVALETERQMLNIHTMDQNLAKQMANFDRLYEDY